MNVVSLAVVCIVVSVTISIDATDPGCKSGFSAFKGHCYLAKSDKLSQQQALDKCHNLGANLASIHSEPEFDFVMGLLKKVPTGPTKRFWIGLKLIRDTKTKLISCHFIDGTAFDYGACATNVGKKPWAHSPGHPADPNNFFDKEACVNMRSDPEFGEGYVDDKCDGTGNCGYVCKY